MNVMVTIHKAKSLNSQLIHIELWIYNCFNLPW